ncbi:hypothetical protein RRG08_023450 [Elysia crispata]|uniref:Uncharacterized protein n=1 Tax=Elysia crispata TaxID=231223 RepID=A0AAE1DWX6_9GAST|nr:hypothetical protein RRG08_023450 [Elysia crispata]
MQGRRKDQVYTVDLLDAVYRIKEAWSVVKEQSVANCFRHAGFVTQNDEAGEQETEKRQEEEEEDEEIPPPPPLPTVTEARDAIK